MVEQSIGILEVAKYVGLIISIIVGVYTIRAQIRKEREKFATKDYVNSKVSESNEKINLMDQKIDAVKDEHSALKDDVTYIRSRIDKLIDLHLKEKK